MRGMQTRQHRREAKAVALHGLNTQSGTAPERVQNPHFEPLVSGRQFDDDYDESEYASGLASVWQLTAAHHVIAQCCCDIYAHYACVADCADAIADAWEDTVGCAHADCLYGNVVSVSPPLSGDCTGSCT